MVLRTTPAALRYREIAVDGGELCGFPADPCHLLSSWLHFPKLTIRLTWIVDTLRSEAFCDQIIPRPPGLRQQKRSRWIRVGEALSLAVRDTVP